MDMKGALTAVALVIFLFWSQPAFATANGCSALSGANPNDLLAIPELAMTDSLWAPGIRCTSEGLRAAPNLCNEKTSITQDQMVGHDRRLLMVRSSSPGDLPLYEVFVFGCVSGQMKKLLHFRPMSPDERISIERATPDKVILMNAHPMTGTGERNRNVFSWNAKIQRYRLEGDEDSDVYPPSAETLSCNKLRAAKANSLIIMANGDFSEGYGGYPFTHGVGCYDDADSCDWKVELDEDRMISDGRRLIAFDSDHQGGVGDWGYVYIFGCVAGQVRTVLGGEFGYGAAVQEVSADKLIVSTLRPGEKDPGCCPTIKVSMTFVWKPELQNYILADVHYDPNKDHTSEPDPTAHPPELQ
jgi:hypothetical protein